MLAKPFVERKPKSEAKVHDNPLLNRIYQNRGVEDSSELDLGLPGLLSPWAMKDMDKATDIIIRHIMNDSKIIIVGDYDCDGATATTIAVQGLTMLGAKGVEYIVPDRMVHGYGLSPSIVELAAIKKPDLIITVDNGIASFEGAKAIKALKHPCELVITDHHLAADEGVPDAAAIINPNQSGCDFQSKSIAGCGVMFYVIGATKTKMMKAGLFEKLGIKPPSISRLLDVLALGTVADVVPLDKNNRIMVTAGLALMRKGLARPVINEIMTLKKRDVTRASASDMGFSVGPCLNAAGRLEDMSHGIEALLSEDPAFAEAAARRLFELNEMRKEVEKDIAEEAFSQIDLTSFDGHGVTVYQPGWHEGVIGIVASRVKEKLQRPVIVFTDTKASEDLRSELEDLKSKNAPENEIKEVQNKLRNSDIKGSARSIEGIHLKHVLDEINKKHPEILTKFGGHAMAAGMSITSKHYNAFSKIFNEIVKREMTVEMLKGKAEVDIMNMDAFLINDENAKEIASAGPWGQGFLEPKFHSKFVVEEIKVLKDVHLKMKLRPIGGNTSIDAISFNSVENGELPTRLGNTIDVEFSLSINEWRGRETLQLMVNYFNDPELQSELIKTKESIEDPNITGAKIDQRNQCFEP